MPSLKGLIADRETLVMKVDGERFEIVYKPSRLSAAHIESWADRLEALRIEEGTENEAVHVYAEMLANIVLEWNLTGPIPDEDVDGYDQGSIVDHDEIVPLTVDALKWIGAPALEVLIEEIRQDSRLKIQRRTGSRSRS